MGAGVSGAHPVRKLSVTVLLDGGTGKMDPVRTCVGCRVREPRQTLIRVVHREAQVLPDERGDLPGRGAWLHPTTHCLEVAVTRKAFSRALRVSSSLDTALLENRLKLLMDN